MLGIMAGMNQRDSYAARCFPVVVNNRCLNFYSAGKLWRSCSMPVLGVFDHGFSDKVICPLCAKTGFMALTVPKTVELHRCSSWAW